MATGSNRPTAPALIVPASTSELHALIDGLRAHHNTLHGGMADIAASLRKPLADVIEGKKGWLGMDAKLAAYRIVRPLMDAAALNGEISRLVVVSYTRYTELVVNAQKATRAKFDING